MSPDEFDPDGKSLPPLSSGPEEEQEQSNRLGDALNGTDGALDGIGLLGGIADGVSSAASATVDALGSVASGAAEIASGAAEAVGGAVEGIGSAAEGIGAAFEGAGAAAEGCGSCSAALLVMLVSAGAVVAAVLR